MSPTGSENEYCNSLESSSGAVDSEEHEASSTSRIDAKRRGMFGIQLGARRLREPVPDDELHIVLQPMTCRVRPLASLYRPRTFSPNHDPAGSTHMRRLFRSVLVIAVVVPACATAQGAQGSTRPDSAIARPVGFFDHIEPLRFTLTADIRLLLSDTADEAPARNASVTFKDAGGKNVTLPVTVRTHGRWRLTHCEFPPLSISFPAAGAAGTPFEGLPRVRLTSFCKDHPAYEQYVLQELQLYRIYQLLTPYGHMARALQVTYVDERTRRTRTTRYAFVIDDREAVATRLNSALLKAKGASGSDLEPWHRTLMGVFEYMIGNTDFLVSELHNAFLLGTPQGETVPVPYDFDYSGAVNTLYAAPNPLLSIRNVRQRVFRGFCSDADQFQKAFALLNEKKPAIYALYNDPIGKLLRFDVANDTKKYFDEFYRVINTPQLAKSEILDRCLKHE